jgi:hypothetical protein
MLHGNPLLRGWSLSDVSFYTTELPQYMLVELARGLNSDVTAFASAMTYPLVVLLAALLAMGSGCRRLGRAPAEPRETRLSVCTLTRRVLNMALALSIQECQPYGGIGRRGAELRQEMLPPTRAVRRGRRPVSRVRTEDWTQWQRR